MTNKQVVWGTVGVIGLLGATAIGIGPGEHKVQPQKIAAVEEATPLVRMSVSAFPVTIDHITQRMNVSVMTVVAPPQMWQNPSYREMLQVGEDNAFPVRVYRIREGVVTEQMTIRLVADSAQLTQFSVGNQFQKGDVLAVEWKPGMLREDGRVPFASVIDNVSNDPVTYPSYNMEITVPVSRKRRAVRS